MAKGHSKWQCLEQWCGSGQVKVWKQLEAQWTAKARLVLGSQVERVESWKFLDERILIIDFKLQSEGKHWRRRGWASDLESWNTGFGVRQTQMLSEGHLVISFPLCLLCLYWYWAGLYGAPGPFCVPHFLIAGNRFHSASVTFPEFQRAGSNSC